MPINWILGHKPQQHSNSTKIIQPMIETPRNPILKTTQKLKKIKLKI